jgi:hypothetical protein
MTQSSHAIEPIELTALSEVTGGGLFGAAWKAAKATYHAVQPVIDHASPFAYVGYKAHSLWHKITENR